MLKFILVASAHLNYSHNLLFDLVSLLISAIHSQSLFAVDIFPFIFGLNLRNLEGFNSNEPTYKLSAHLWITRCPKGGILLVFSCIINTVKRFDWFFICTFCSFFASWKQNWIFTCSDWLIGWLAWYQFYLAHLKQLSFFFTLSSNSVWICFSFYITSFVVLITEDIEVIRI